ncbi:unnamed protein product [Candidula unifasciata]|uniref:Leucine-rich repeat-containing protein 15 n=1 Tax=Candidula unifasciata TaxID=100452 RepID=A0A8S3YGG7_9EUPU|nr:unnamed protein product [Candidula unifasciata]
MACLYMYLSLGVAMFASGTKAADVPCPSRCRSCENQVAECAKRSLTAPPTRYPQGTKIINLEGNHIRVIAEKTFGDLPSVEVLKMSGNKIVALRNDAFSAFPNLISLDLVDNRISKISRRAFKDLDKLRTLSINKNKIETLEGILQYIPNLFQLNVANNRIITIGQNDLTPLSRVHYLDFRDNLVSNIHPEAFKHLDNLRYLFLNNNPLVVTPVFQFGSQVLQLVDLSHCDLKGVPGPFPASVTDLRLGNNKIMQVLGSDLLNITDLQLLTLNDNELHFLADGSLTHLTQLQEVWLRHNNLVYIPRNLPDNVRKIHVDSNNIQQIEVGLFSNMSHLDYLTVENNQINGIQPNTFTGLRFLNTINFQGNQIRSLETDTFVDLGSLSTILLSNNPLKRIQDGAFKNLGNLTQLFLCYIDEDDFKLEGNFLQEMLRLETLQMINSPGLVEDFMVMINDSAFTPVPLEKLTQLDLSYNNLHWVSPRIKEMFPNLLSMPLDGNPLRCSKQLKWLRDWMVSSEVSFHNHNEIVCETPARLKNRAIRSIQDHEWADEKEAETAPADVANSGKENATLKNKQGEANTEEEVQRDATETRTKKVQNLQGMAKRSRDEKDQGKIKGKGRKGKKRGNDSKGDKKERGKTAKGKKNSEG